MLGGGGKRGRNTKENNVKECILLDAARFTKNIKRAGCKMEPIHLYLPQSSTSSVFGQQLVSSPNPMVKAQELQKPLVLSVINVVQILPLANKKRRSLNYFFNRIP
jgi:hypothetical protein